MSCVLFIYILCGFINLFLVKLIMNHKYLVAIKLACFSVKTWHEDF